MKLMVSLHLISSIKRSEMSSISKESYQHEGQMVTEKCSNWDIITLVIEKIFRFSFLDWYMSLKI